MSSTLAKPFTIKLPVDNNNNPLAIAAGQRLMCCHLEENEKHLGTEIDSSCFEITIQELGSSSLVIATAKQDIYQAATGVTYYQVEKSPKGHGRRPCLSSFSY